MLVPSSDGCASYTVGLLSVRLLIGFDIPEAAGVVRAPESFHALPQTAAASVHSMPTSATARCSTVEATTHIRDLSIMTETLVFRHPAALVKRCLS